MDCDICSRDFSSRRRPLCASCVQATLYERRVQQASSLLDREKSHTHAEAIIRPGNEGVLSVLPEDVDLETIGQGVQKHSHERNQAEQTAVEQRIEEIVTKAEELRNDMAKYQARIAAQEQDLERRRRELNVERREAERQRPRLLDPVRNDAQKASQKLDKVRSKTVDARLLLCREAASVSNLQRCKTDSGKSEYTVGDMPIPNLRELNTRTQAASSSAAVDGRTVAEPHDRVSEALDNVARLVSLAAHYLGVRLPAEIILPHNDFPRAVIMPEKSSYKSRDVPFPASSTSQASTSAAPRMLDRNTPRPRPLWLDRSLAQLMKDDQKTYYLYIEGVTLLAWDLAWLCRTQGIDSIVSWEDVCSIGRNLWLLLMSQHRRRPGLDRRTTGVSSKDGAGQEVVRLGMFSHASAQHNLASSEGYELLKDWKVASLQRLTDKLKAHFMSEMSGAEWDVIEEREWDEQAEHEMPVFVGGSGRPQDSRHPAMSVMTVVPHDTTEDDQAARSDMTSPKKHDNGWTRLRSR